MTLERLNIFLRIVETGSVSAAAKAVHLTQPATSRNLQALEESVGTPLFDRVGRRLVLRPAGRALVPLARELLRDADHARRAVQRAHEGGFDFRIGAIDSVASTLLPQAVVDLRARWPALQVNVRTGRTTTLLDGVANDQLDAAIVAYSSPPPGARVHRVGRYRMRYWGHRDHFPALAAVEDEPTLMRFPIAEIAALPGQPTMITANAASYAVCSSVASVKSFVMAGFAVGALLDFMLDDQERALLVCANRVPHDLDCGIYLVGASGEAAKPVESDLVDALSTVFSVYD